MRRAAAPSGAQLGEPGGGEASVERERELLPLAAAAVAPRQPSEGLGDDLRLDGRGMLGSGLELDGELIQLSLFTRNGRAERLGRIARPSRRR